VEIESLASYKHCIERISANWSAFLEKRRERLAQQERHGVAAEKVAENILEDLFSAVLDWPLSDINNQLEHADLVLTRLGIKKVIVEVKRPGALAWSRKAVERALEQARRYAGEQDVKTIAVSDGYLLYAADIEHGGLEDRLFVDLSAAEPPKVLWWLSVQAIYRPREPAEAALQLLPEIAPVEATPTTPDAPELLHPKYHLPCHCFAHVGNPADVHSWKLPYRNADGTVDPRRLPKAIQAILTNYRGAQVKAIPERAIPDVLVRLARAASSLGKMPHQCGDAAAIYRELREALEQVGRLQEVLGA
jgi:hypothetical protein